MHSDLHYVTPGEAYEDIVGRCLAAVDDVAPRGMQTRELLNVQVTISLPAFIPFDCSGRDLNHTITALEMMQLIGQTPADAFVRERNKSLARFQDYGIAYGNYGARLRGQLTNIVRELERDQYSRRAVATIYHGPYDLGQETLDVPCTLSAQFFIRRGKLQTRVSMRSNDVWLGLPYDLMQFSLLHLMMAQVLNVLPGGYTHCVGSMHLYERNVQAATELGEIHNYDYGEQPFYVHSVSALDRLDAITSWCQSVFTGQASIHAPFERWIMETLWQ